MATAAEDKTKLPEDYSCGYCLQRSAYMTDPRALPCSHIFCLPCIQADYRELERVDCAICGRSHDIRDFKALKKANWVEQYGSAALLRDDDGVVFTQCDLCKENKSESVVFCSDCGKKLCKGHLKVHGKYTESFASKAHLIINMEEYVNNHARYERETCDDHDGEQPTRACSKCRHLFCTQCNAEEQCTVTEEPHDIVELDSFAQRLRAEMKEKMRVLSNRISSVCKEEKVAWSRYSEVEGKAERSLREIDLLAEVQINKIRENTKKLKKGIQQSVTTTMVHVEDYSNYATGVKGNFEHLWKSSSQFLSQSKDSEVVRQRSNVIEELDKAIKSRVFLCPEIFKPLWKEQLADLDLVGCYKKPATIEYERMLSNGSAVSVCWMQNGQLVYSGARNFIEYNSKFQPKTVSHQFQIDTVVASPTGFAAITNTNVGQGYPSELLYFNSELIQVKFVDCLSEYSNPVYNLMTIVPSSNEVVAIEQSKHQVKRYSQQGDLLYTSELKDIQEPSAIHALEDGCVLVADYNNGNVTKYRLLPKELQYIWTCGGMKNPTAISSDMAGFIYCLATTQSAIPAIFVLSEDGEIVTNMIHQNLSTWTRCDMAVSKDDKLAIACKEQGVAMFNITRGDY